MLLGGKHRHGAKRRRLVIRDHLDRYSIISRRPTFFYYNISLPLNEGVFFKEKRGGVVDDQPLKMDKNAQSLYGPKPVDPDKY